MVYRGRRVVARLMAALLVLVGTVFLSVEPARASGGYPYWDYNGPGSDPANYVWTSPTGALYSPYGFVHRNCVDFVAWKLNATNGYAFHNSSPTGTYSNAMSWGARATANGYPPDMNPAVGAVAWWDANAYGMSGYGHVAWVSAVNGNSVTVEEYNNPGGGNWGTRTFDKSQVSGYIHFKDLSGSSSAVTNPDFNGDQYGDLAWHQGTTLTLFASQGGGTFGYVGASGGIGTPTWAGAGDVNGDKQVDVIWYTGTTLAVFKWGNGSWSWVNQTTGIGAPDYAVVGDFNGDGRADLAWHSGTTLTLFTGTASNTFAYGGATGGIGTPQWARGANVNGGNKDEVVWYSNNTLTTLGWNGSGWGWVNATSGVGVADGAAVGDFTGDGRDDIAWHQGNTLHLYGGLANGKFGYVGGTGGIASGSWTGAADVNKDGDADVIWYQGTTIHTYGWTGGGWGYMGGTPGIGAPGFAIASG